MSHKHERADANDRHMGSMCFLCSCSQPAVGRSSAVGSVIFTADL